MHNPPHPGETLRDDVLPALGLRVTDAAQQLGMTLHALSRVLYAEAEITPEMALRLEGLLGQKRGGDARLWLEQQGAYDLWRKLCPSRIEKIHLISILRSMPD